jgi:hypothetical protein
LVDLLHLLKLHFLNRERLLCNRVPISHGSLEIRRLE